MARAKAKRFYLRFLRRRLRFGMGLLSTCVLLVADSGQLTQKIPNRLSTLSIEISPVTRTRLRTGAFQSGTALS
jgi:hypothetical protein